MIFPQMFDMVNEGIVVLDRELNVYKWNRWMEIHSKIPAAEIIGESVFSFFPNLDAPWFLRNCKSIFKFGNFAFFSQKLHRFCFPFKPASPVGNGFEHMQQSCTMGPLRDDQNQITHLFITVQDVTEVAAYEQKLIEMNIRDAMTQTYNRNHFTTRLEEEFERHVRYGRPLSLIIQDIDFFKEVNDTHGHLCGDDVLKSFAALNQSIIRDVDLFARYGGEEFCCLMPETDLAAAVNMAERLRKEVSEKTFHFEGKDIKITMSQGIAELNTETDTVESMLKAADKALYQAKNSGRNKVVIRKGLATSEV